ncbi:NAD-dependent epimerase/dehydratase family protein [Parvularcula flava]|uniref:NAD-dependent epimerase/dehydratase family protein n=1 Tax=Aquisalinus luteolus TaxID=1566827 RepID=A0A8J3EPU2_9PROT|nr:vitamin K epoxide reductase family protein [Aquisalinus luteolus]NHK26406.1 NAD-dependent epimerase/dehydratase family protein [Aquisalinus luteolus]GGH92241.1 vitamin K epoxide reductase [Aquisalinus luteolus]
MQQKQDDRPLVVITGASGAIGAGLIGILKQDYLVIGLDLDCGDLDISCIEFDITDEKSVHDALSRLSEEHGTHIAAVIHLAAYFDFTGEHSPLYDKVNVQGTRHLLRALQDFDVDRFFYSGTMLVHEATTPGHRIDEQAPIAPKWAYPESKAKTEQAIREERGTIPVTLFHLAGLYDEETAVPTLSHQIARIYESNLKSHIYSGETDCGQSMIHRDDLLELFRRGIENRDAVAEEEVILAGEPEGVSYAALQDEIGCLIHGKEKWLTLEAPKPLAKAGAALQAASEPVVPDAIDRGEKPFIRPFMIDMAEDHYGLDISKAKNLLGWEPAHDIRDELPALIATLKDDPLAWYEANGITPPDWLETGARHTNDPEDMRAHYQETYLREHTDNRWAHLINAALGLWLIGSPVSLGYESTLMAWSDVTAGAVILVFGLLSASSKLEPARWVVAAAGLWLLAAPLLFWAPTAAAYLNGTLVGALTMGFALCTRPSPGVSIHAAETGPDIPPGWDFSPSTWTQRLPIIILAVIGFLISRHMTAYQLGHIDGIWDPFFAGGPDPKNGSEEITTSSVSEAWPVPDAGVGALTYMLEIITGIVGSRRRWRTMPWLVLLFGIMIVPLGVVSISFIIIQPIVIGTWCTLCLIAAAAMLLQIPYSLDELVATCQFLIRRKKQGRPLLRIFFTGDTDEGENVDADDFHRHPLAIWKDMWTGGVAFTWNLSLCILIGIWLMFTRLTLGAEGAMAGVDHVVGALVVTTSVIAYAEMARILRYLNMGFGLTLMIAPMVLEATPVQWVAAFIAGTALIVLSIRQGPVNHQYGGIT